MQAPGQILFDMILQTSPFIFRLRFCPQGRGTRQIARINQRGFDHRFFFRTLDRLGDRSAGMAYFASHVPKSVEHLFDHFLRRLIGSSFPNKNEIDIARWAHFIAAKTTYCSQD